MTHLFQIIFISPIFKMKFMAYKKYYKQIISKTRYHNIIVHIIYIFLPCSTTLLQKGNAGQEICPKQRAIDSYEEHLGCVFTCGLVISGI